MQSIRFLIAPLDWGLGHATRCVPIIRQLLLFNCEVIIAGNGKSLALLKIEFPHLSFVELPAYDPQYSAGKSLLLKIISQLFKFNKTIKAEHKVIQKIVSEKRIDIIISDNRFGCWSAMTRNIFITHQVNILMPSSWQWLGWFVNRINHQYIKKFTDCWVPDHEGENYTGAMSASKTIKVKWLGMLSRFTYDPARQCDAKFDILVVLSGPEPQRRLLEELLVKQISQTPFTALIVRGIPGDSNRKILSRVEVVDFLNADELEKAIQQSDLIIARSGYSTVMDMAAMKSRVLFIPTPGQTEQAYLARQLKVKRIAYFADQNKLHLKEAIEKAKDYTGFVTNYNNNSQLKNIIQELL